MADILGKIEKVGGLALVGGLAYLIWTNWDKITSAMCRLPGAHEIFGSEMCPDGLDPPIPYECPPGYTMNSNGLCIIDPVECPDGFYSEFGVCKPYPDQPQPCPTGKVWDSILKACVTLMPGIKTCPDGTKIYEYQTCPVVPDVKPCVPNNGMGGDYFTCEDGHQECLLSNCQEQQGIFGCSDKHGVPTKTKYVNGEWIWLDVPCNEGKMVAGICPDGHTAFYKSPGTLEEVCNQSFADVNCYQKWWDCGGASAGLGSAVGKTPEGCLADGYIYFDGKGACWNQARQNFMDCMGECPNY